MADPVLGFGQDDTEMLADVPGLSFGQDDADMVEEVPAEPRVTPLRFNLGTRRVPPLRINVSNLLSAQVSPLRINRSRFQSSFRDSFNDSAPPRVSPLRLSRIQNEDTFEVLPHDTHEVDEAEVTIVHGDDTVEIIPGDFHILHLFNILQTHSQGHPSQFTLEDRRG